MHRRSAKNCHHWLNGVFALFDGRVVKDGDVSVELSDKWWALRLGVDRDTVRRWRKDETTPDADVVANVIALGPPQVAAYVQGVLERLRQPPSAEAAKATELLHAGVGLNATVAHYLDVVADATADGHVDDDERAAIDRCLANVAGEVAANRQTAGRCRTTQAAAPIQTFPRSAEDAA